MSSTVYIRIGTWRPQEYSLNYAQGKTEAGVSVFEAVPEDGKYRILLDEAHDPDGRQKDTLSGLLHQIQQNKSYGQDYDPIYIVTGDHVGTGYDGEPLLKSLRIVAEVEAESLI